MLFEIIYYIQWSPKYNRITQRSKALQLSASGVTTDPGSIPGFITTGRDWESHREKAQVAQRRPG